MRSPRPIDLGRFGALLVVVALLAGPGARHALSQSLRIESTGLRYGVGAEKWSRDFNEADAFINLNLPWLWHLGEGWCLQPQADIAGGWLGADDENGFIGKVGLSLRLFYQDFPLSFTGGSGPTYISRHAFNESDLGTYFQFSTFLGANLDLSKHLRICYRFQHMSNAGISAQNPGLNLHMLGISYLW